MNTETNNTRSNYKRNLVRFRKVYRRVDRTFTRMGDFMMNLVFHRGRPGSIDFNAAPEFADGTILLRQFGDGLDTEGKPLKTEIAFRVENRWMVRQGRPSNAFLNEIMSRCLEAGFKPAYIKWNCKIMMPYDVAALSAMRRPDDTVLPPARLWTEKQSFPQYSQDVAMARNSTIIQRF